MKRRSRKETNTKDRKMFSRFTAFACVTVISSGMLLGGCGGPGPGQAAEGEEAQKDTSILVETALPQTESIELSGNFIGTVESEDEITVVAKAGGDVTATYFEEGDRVNAGDLLFTVDDASAQISMAQAQASLESANASVVSANASVTSASASAVSASANVSLNELNLLYTQEQIKQSLGQVDTNEMQLENAVASAKYALKAAQENEALAAEQFGLARDAYEDLEDNMDDLRDNANNMNKYAKQLQQVKNRYDDIRTKNANDAESAVEQMGIRIPDNVDTGSAQAIANYYIYEMTDGAAGSEYDLGVMISAAQSQEQTLRSTRSSLDDNKDSLRLSQISAAISKETAKNNVYSAEDALRLAEKMLEDYELYTKAVVIAGANYQLAGANMGLISAQTGQTQAEAGVTQAQAGVSQAQAGVKQAEAGVQAAQLQLDYTRVSSPVSGVVTQKNVTVNNMAAQGSPAYVIAADDGMNVVFYVAETVMKELEIGQDISVERNGELYEAKISENVGVADATSGLFKIKAQLTTGTDRLITGTNVKITLATQRADNVMTIPVDSVYYESQKAYVYCMENGKAVKTQIETGITNNESVEVKSGLTKDSQVITTWTSQLKDGSDVKVKGQETGNNVPEGSEKEEDSVQAQEQTQGAEEASAAGVTDTERLRLSVENRVMQQNGEQ